MIKVENYIEVRITLSLEEARELRKDLGKSTYQPTYAIFDALDEALKQVEEVSA